jgi:L-rhamnose isomerase
VYAEGTVEEDVVSRAVKRLVSMGEMQGDDIAGLRDLEGELTGMLETAAFDGDD